MSEHCELSLFGQMPLTRHDQVLGILVGLSAMQPRLVYERHFLLAPLTVSTDNDTDTDQQAKKKPTQKKRAQAPPAYIHLINHLDEADISHPSPVTVEAIQATPDSWSIRIKQTPEPETKSLVVRRVQEYDNSARAITSLGLLDTTRHRHVTDYVLEIQQLIYRDVVLLLQRVLLRDDKSAELTLLDRSGAFLLEARVGVDDRSKPALMQAASEQLHALRAELKGCVELRAPDRLSLDTRIRV